MTLEPVCSGLAKAGTVTSATAPRLHAIAEGGSAARAEEHDPVFATFGSGGFGKGFGDELPVILLGLEAEAVDVAGADVEFEGGLLESEL